MVFNIHFLIKQKYRKLRKEKREKRKEKRGKWKFKKGSRMARKDINPKNYHSRPNNQ